MAPPSLTVSRACMQMSLDCSSSSHVDHVCASWCTAPALNCSPFSLEWSWMSVSAAHRLVLNSRIFSWLPVNTPGCDHNGLLRSFSYQSSLDGCSVSRLLACESCPLGCGLNESLLTRLMSSIVQSSGSSGRGNDSGTGSCSCRTDSCCVCLKRIAL